MGPNTPRTPFGHRLTAEATPSQGQPPINRATSDGETTLGPAQPAAPSAGVEAFLTAVRAAAPKPDASSATQTGAAGMPHGTVGARQPQPPYASQPSLANSRPSAAPQSITPKRMSPPRRLGNTLFGTKKRGSLTATLLLIGAYGLSVTTDHDPVTMLKAWRASRAHPQTGTNLTYPGGSITAWCEKPVLEVPIKSMGSIVMKLDLSSSDPNVVAAKKQLEAQFIPLPIEPFKTKDETVAKPTSSTPSSSPAPSTSSQPNPDTLVRRLRKASFDGTVPIALCFTEPIDNIVSVHATAETDGYDTIEIDRSKIILGLYNIDILAKAVNYERHPFVSAGENPLFTQAELDALNNRLWPDSKNSQSFNTRYQESFVKTTLADLGTKPCMQNIAQTVDEMLQQAFEKQSGKNLHVATRGSYPSLAQTYESIKKPQSDEQVGMSTVDTTATCGDITIAPHSTGAAT